MKQIIIGLFIITTQVYAQEKIVNKIDQQLLNTLRNNSAENGIVIFKNIEKPQENYSVGFVKTKSGYKKNNGLIRLPIEPGGFMLPISSALLIDQFNVKLSDSIDIEGGKTKINLSMVYDSENHGLRNTSLLDIVAISSNVGIAKFMSSKITTNKEKEILISSLKNYLPNINIPTSILSNNILPWIGFGYGITTSPDDIANFYTNIATNSIKFRDTTSNQFIKKCLEEVMVSGTGKQINDISKQFAGKTATIKVVKSTVDDPNQYYAGFVGYYPTNNPQYVCLVLIKCKPNASQYYGATVAGPLFKEIIESKTSIQK